ncbi:MAG: YggU family protein [Nitrospinae bacterium CG11_big_fil_rev_8_21_14_0_20_56_8]|nr:MAG: YggU family protein [Nitrospinae bacterium CG11_big_fil_rev_8_21_14_0_20_56_8]
MPPNLKVKILETGIQFSAAIQPRASKNEIAGLKDDALKIRLTSPPVDGEANRACIKFLAKWLKVSPSQITIVTGQTGRRKIIRIDGMSGDEFFGKLAPILGDPLPS